MFEMYWYLCIKWENKGEQKRHR